MVKDLSEGSCEMIKEVKEKALEDKVPIIKDDGLSFLLHLIKERGCRSILELGTAVGYSSMQMAMLDEEIQIDTIEKKEEMCHQAVENIEKAGLKERIHVHFLPIEEFRSDKKYDLIFVDAAKAQYSRYLEQFIGNLKEDGVMVFDNMVFHQMIYDPENIASRGTRALVRKIIKFREEVRKDDRFDIIFYDNVGDGILVLNRRK